MGSTNEFKDPRAGLSWLLLALGVPLAAKFLLEEERRALDLLVAAALVVLGVGGVELRATRLRAARVRRRTQVLFRRALARITPNRGTRERPAAL